MREKQYLQYCVEFFACAIMLCVMLSGCGIRDSALVIPIEETGGEIGEDIEKVLAVENDGGTEDFFGGEPVGREKEAAKQQAMIYVYVCGAVCHPGVVELPEGSRADDALAAAGGFSENARMDYVNLAAKVIDGEKLYFPNMEEAAELELSTEEEQNGLVNINTADETTLMTLPGIGESRARDIIAYREKYGDFQNKEDLQKISGIKENLYAKLCDKIVVR